MYHVLPTVPSSFRASHQLPFLSTISKISPLEKEISFESSFAAVSAAEKLKISMTLLGGDSDDLHPYRAFALYRYAASEPMLELSSLDSGSGGRGLGLTGPATEFMLLALHPARCFSRSPTIFLNEGRFNGSRSQLERMTFIR